MSFTGIVTSTQAFNHLEYEYQCKTTREDYTEGDKYRYKLFKSSKKTPPSPPPAPVTRQTVTWTFSIGTGTGECVHDKNIFFSAKVRDTSSGTRWSHWVSTGLPINPPPQLTHPKESRPTATAVGYRAAGGKAQWNGEA